MVRLVPASVMSCAQLATVPALGRCPAGAATAAFPAAALGGYGVFDGSILTGITWPAANVPAARLDTLGVDSIYSIYVGTGGSTAAIEQARSPREDSRAYPVLSAPSAPGDRSR